MYRKSRHDDELPEIGLYVEGHLNPANRWVGFSGTPYPVNPWDGDWAP